MYLGPSRKLIRATGGDVMTFLQGLVTNDVGKLAQGLVYAAMLTPQGKYLADFFLVPDGADVLIDVDAGLAEGLAGRLNMYKLRADVDLSWDAAPVACGLGTRPEGAFADPRTAALGWRAYGEGFVDEDHDWDALRVANSVPASGIELTPDSFILEMGFEALNGVDFRKGCYVGQEVTARMKHKTELRKGLAQVRIDGAAETGTKITAAGKPAGTLLTRAGDLALAYVRYDRLTEGGQAGQAQVTRLTKRPA